ncbi:MAG: transcriptional repressor [Propionibacterium sp.]|nr:transcriptional repressor [Propionibacterium sp.]
MTSTRRNTWQRAAVRDFLSGTEEFKTAQQVHVELMGMGDKVGLATVYRALQAMSETHEIDTVRTLEGELAYRACTPGHHHHLVCRQCAFTVEIKADEVEEWAHAVAKEHGFTDAGHEIEVFGLCAECSALEEGQ